MNVEDAFAALEDINSPATTRLRKADDDSADQHSPIMVYRTHYHRPDKRQRER